MDGIGLFSEGGGYVMGWGTLGLINAGLAQLKGKSGFTWFLLSLFLGPIATFLLVMETKEEKETANR